MKRKEVTFLKSHKYVYTVSIYLYIYLSPFKVWKTHNVYVVYGQEEY